MAATRSMTKRLKVEALVGMRVYRMAQHIKIQIGDIFEFRIPGDRYAYCQYVHWNEQDGYVVRVLDKITDRPVSSVGELSDAGDLFPPVFVGLRTSVSSGRWKQIGNAAVKDFRLPQFRAIAVRKPGTYENWWLWDGKTERFIGKLPPELRSLDLRQVWGDELLEERIATGRDPFAGVQ
jgi:hypothetical protein